MENWNACWLGEKTDIVASWIFGRMQRTSRTPQFWNKLYRRDRKGHVEGGVAINVKEGVESSGFWKAGRSNILHRITMG